MSTRSQLLCLILIGLGLAAATSHWRRPAPAQVESKAQKYLYCPVCGLEMTMPADVDQKHSFCPHCGVDHPMQVSTFSRTNGELPTPPANRLLIAAMFGVPVALAVGVYTLGRARNPGLPEADGDLFRFECPRCGHVIASNSYRKGSTAVCPACAEMFVATTRLATDLTDERIEKAQEFEDGLRNALRTNKPERRRPRNP
jgi:transcription elongation factor Elf1